MAKDLERTTERRPHNMLAPFDQLQREMDRLFADYTTGLRWPEMTFDRAFALAPAIEMHQADGKTVVTAELPGVDKSDVDISVDDNMLILSGEKKSETERKDGDTLHTERSYGSFRRVIALPFAIDEKKVSAKFDKGVLTVTLDHPAEIANKTRHIAIH